MLFEKGLKFSLTYFLIVASMGGAVASTPGEEYGKYFAKTSSVSPISEFGDSIGIRDGKLSFRQVDLEIAGIGPPIRIARSFMVEGRPGGGRLYETSGSRMGQWELIIPRLKTLTSAKDFAVSQNSPVGWQVQLASNARCSQIDSPGDVLPVKADPIEDSKWWAGYQLVEDLGQEEDVLGHTAEAGQPSHVARTKGNWIIGCLPSTSNGQPGEAFIATAPDGTRYWLDYLVYRNGEGINGAGPGALPRNYASMLTTRVEDVFGNWLKYSYDGSGILAAIEASDGRAVSLSNDGTNITSLIVQNGAARRSWTYGYQDGVLASVMLPDGSSWRYSMNQLANLTSPTLNVRSGVCYAPASESNDGLTGDVKSGTMFSPSGAAIDYSVRVLHVGRSNVPRSCWGDAGQYAEIPRDFWSYAISSKRITGPGISPQEWRYEYSPANASWDEQCSSGCANTVWTKVIDPDGSSEISTFSNKFDATENLKLREEIYGPAGDLLSSADFSYAVAPVVGAGSYPWSPLEAGTTFTPRSNLYSAGGWTPVLSKVINEAGRQYRYDVRSYDALARPVAVTRSSN